MTCLMEPMQCIYKGLVMHKAILALKARLKAKWFTEHLYVRLFGVFLVIFDIIIVIVDIIEDPVKGPYLTTYDIISLTILSYFIMELSLRMFAKGKKFFYSTIDLIDTFIVFLTGSVTIVYVSVDFSGDVGQYYKLVVVCRLMRVFLFVRLLTERDHVNKASRRMVSENKRRYREEGFDLDLTYITDRIIATSFPSSGKQKLYRNSIKEVSKFLEFKHCNHYKVYNLCSEKHYDESYFQFRVQRVMIDDHNVPHLVELQKFTANAKEWIEKDPKNVIVVHCKGGKGRTGTCISCWLLESAEFKTAKEALDHFGNRRTDYDVGSKFQGVQTPSQARYVGYYEMVKYTHNGMIPNSSTFKIESIQVQSLQGFGAGNGSDLSLEVMCSGKTILKSVFAKNLNCTAIYDAGKDNITANLINCPPFKGDIKIRFTSSHKKVPKAYDHCAFFFWFHTAFIKNDSLFLTRDELDNPHKDEQFNVFNKNFAVHVKLTQNC
ncbi:phosphatidylinositol 3,4,5-trisphosphate 3-phosphatase TPTE2-like [Antedon mediterranea]|uniref:phosphatidylinositol 3,4,5-trisphosphate 3-phosphatase TPTE2-like n=1 Tax=Antedon mediterranea TaxID=105859 RepID=UPI003AF7CF14